MGRSRNALLVLLLGLAPLGTRPAQAASGSAEAPSDSSCTYARCALAVVPAWNGLDVVRGEQEQKVARLGFFWTRDVSPVFAGEPHALDFARRAVRTRRTAAVFTDAGIALLAYALIGGTTDSGHTSTYQGIAIGGAAAFAVGVPLQFAADGHLSRAVWWHNAQFAR